MKRASLFIICLLIASTVQAQDTSGLGNLIKKVDATNTNLNALRKDTQETIEILDTNMTEAINGLFGRLIAAVVGVQLFLIGTTKVLGGLVKYYNDRKKLRIKDKRNEKLDILISLLSTPNIRDILKEIEVKKVSQKPKSKIITISILLGILAITVILILNRLGVIG